jgi:hypothetical protein
MAPQASKKCGLLPPDQQQIGFWTSTDIDSEQVPGTISSVQSHHSGLAKKIMKV